MSSTRGRRYRRTGTTDVSVRPFFRFMQGAVELSDWVRGSTDRRVEYDGRPMALYEGSRTFGFPPVHGSAREWDGRDGLAAKARVLGVAVDGAALGFPRPVVEDAGGVVRATVGDTDVVVFATERELAAYEDPGIGFEPTDGQGQFRGDGTRWDAATGGAGDGRVLDRLPGRWTFAFAWATDHGPARFYDTPGRDAAADGTGVGD